MDRRRFLKIASGNRRNILSLTGLIWYAPDGANTINLTAAALWSALPAEHRSIYFSDPDDDATLLDDTTIITNIEASPYLNDGGELIGTEAKGYTQYADGTAESDLLSTYRYFGLSTTWVDIIPALSISPTSYDFGEIVYSVPEDYEFTLSNTGNGPAEGITIAISGADFQLLSSAGPFDVAAGATAAVQVRFDPTAAGTSAESLTISWPNRDDIVVELDGTSVVTGTWITDDFNRADDGILGANWTTNIASGGNVGITSNQAAGKTGDHSFAVWTAGSFNADQAAQIKVVDYVARPIVRASTIAFTYYSARVLATALYIMRQDAKYKEVSLLAIGSMTIAIGDIIRIVVVGSTISVYQNGTLRGQATDSTYASGGVGIRCIGTGTRAEDFAGGDYSAMP